MFKKSTATTLFALVAGVAIGYFLFQQLTTTPPCDLPAPIELEGGFTSNETLSLQWEPVANAASYLIDVTKISGDNTGPIITNFSTTDTQIDLDSPSFASNGDYLTVVTPVCVDGTTSSNSASIVSCQIIIDDLIVKYEYSDECSNHVCDCKNQPAIAINTTGSGLRTFQLDSGDNYYRVEITCGRRKIAFVLNSIMPAPSSNLKIELPPCPSSCEDDTECLPPTEAGCGILTGSSPSYILTFTPSGAAIFDDLEQGCTIIVQKCKACTKPG